MASTYKNILTTVGSTGDVTIYTCPDATEALIKNINLYNSHSGAIVVYSKITDSSASATVTLKKESMATLATSTALEGPYVLEAGDLFILNCDTASKIMAFANVLEVSR
jgi:ribosomal 30S subunit maturation factor RimM